MEDAHQIPDRVGAIKNKFAIPATQALHRTHLGIKTRVIPFICVLHERPGGKPNRNGRDRGEAEQEWTGGNETLWTLWTQLAMPMPWPSQVADHRWSQKETMTGRAEEPEKLGLFALHMGGEGFGIAVTNANTT